MHLTFVIPPVGKVGGAATGRRGTRAHHHRLHQRRVVAPPDHGRAPPQGGERRRLAAARARLRQRRAQGQRHRLGLHAVLRRQPQHEQRRVSRRRLRLRLRRVRALHGHDLEQRRLHYRPDLYDGVLAHEIGHIFGALDEYAPPARGYPSTGNLYSGYLWVRNETPSQGGTTNDVCIMRGGRRGHRRLQGRAVRRATVTSAASARRPPARSAGATRLATASPTWSTPRRPSRFSQPTLDGVTATVAGVALENPCPPGHNAKGRAFAKGISMFVPHDVRLQRRRWRLDRR